MAVVGALSALGTACSTADDSAASTTTAKAATTTASTTAPPGPCALEPDTRVEDLTFAELSRYELNNGEPVPTFAAFLDLADRAKVGVLPEIKYFPSVDGGDPVPWTDAQLAEFQKMIEQRKNLKEVLMGSFADSALAYFKANKPEWTRVWFRGIGGKDPFAPPTVAEMRERAPSANALGVINVLYLQGTFAPDGKEYDVPKEFAEAGIPVDVWFNVTTKGDSPEGAEPFAGVPSLGWTGIVDITPKNVRWISTDRVADYTAWSRTPAAGSPAPTMIAHRGGGEDGVSENSLAAYTQAVKDGAGILETDVQWTRPTAEDPNGVPVLMHDATVNRTTRCPG
ncbi:MAG: glycerophosphodiester phosphodiesterase [Actinomycetes bacterium]